jgi:hypothetical protein
VEQWINRSRTDMVAVALQFFSHAQAEDGLLGRVMQDVQTDRTRVEVPTGSGLNDFDIGSCVDLARLRAVLRALERTLAGMIRATGRVCTVPRLVFRHLVNRAELGLGGWA